VFVMPVATRGSVAAGSHTGPLLWGAMTTDPASPTPSDATGSLAASSTEVLPETDLPVVADAAPALDLATETTEERTERFEAEALPLLDQLYSAALRTDAQSRGRRGPRPGDLCQGLRSVPPIPPGDEPQGVDVPHPHQHLHQLLPQEAARAAAVRRRPRSRTTSCTRAESHSSSGLRSAETRRWTICPTPTSSAPCPDLRGLPAGGLPRRRRGVLPTRRSPRSWAPPSAP
jgi:RNA polymerase sigma-70 factor (ECF subfamily)